MGMIFIIFFSTKQGKKTLHHAYLNNLWKIFQTIFVIVHFQRLSNVRKVILYRNVTQNKSDKLTEILMYLF